MKTIECENTNCKKKLRKVSLNCLKCNYKYCSEKCLEVHKLTSCQDESSAEDESIEYRSSKLNLVDISRVIKSGTYLKILDISPLFDFENFDIVLHDDMPQIIGHGLYGDLYLAKNINNDKLYCIKRMLKSRIEEENISNEIIYNEINLHLKLVHDNIIRLHSFSESDEAFNLIMDYAPNGNLSSLIKSSNGFDERTAFKYFIQTSYAINFLHENNLVHRDIKPENILLDENYNIKLCDFGWCAELSQGNRLTFCGTYEYMAPELIDEMPYNQSIDLWALGVLLFELTQGFSPFSSENDDYMEIMKKVKINNLTFEKPISSECEDMIRKLLSQDKNKRPKIKDIFNHPWTLSFQIDSYNDKKVIRASDSTKPTSTISRISTDNNKNCRDTEVKSVYRASKFDISNISKITLDNNDVTSINRDINELLFYKGKKNSKEKNFNKMNLLEIDKRNYYEEQTMLNKKDLMSYQNTTEKKGINNFNLMEEICNEVNKYEKSENEYFQKTNQNQQIHNKLNEKQKKNPSILRKDTEYILENDFPNDLKNKNIKQKNDKNKLFHKNLNLEEELKDEQEPFKINLSKVNYTSNSNPMKNTVILDLDKYKKTLKKEEKEKNKRQFITALNILEKAEDSKSVVQKKETENSNKNGGFWNFLNPFKCGLD